MQNNAKPLNAPFSEDWKLHHTSTTVSQWIQKVSLHLDAFSLYVLQHPSPRNDAINALNVIFVHWITRLGIPDMLATDNGNECINS